jgi:hypothetical protein
VIEFGKRVFDMLIKIGANQTDPRRNQWAGFVGFSPVSRVLMLEKMPSVRLHYHHVFGNYLVSKEP